MIIERYSDLKYLEDNIIVDISKLSIILKKRVIDYLAGWTAKGSLIKISKDKYLIRRESYDKDK